MNIENAFSSPIIADYLECIDNDKLKDYASQLKATSPGREKSNFHGWQSNDVDNSNTEIKKLSHEITQRITYLYQEFGLKTPADVFISNMWININPTGGFNRPHIHPESLFSGVYYVDSNENDGCIVFKHPAINHQYHIKGEIDRYTNFTSSVYRVTPMKGKLVIFPSWLEHYVEPNITDTNRISISFNTRFKILQ
jgi:uncharacterized protein (TIGR02466 family)